MNRRRKALASPDNAGELFGLWADEGIRSVSHRDTVTREKWRWSPRDGTPAGIGDAMIAIL